MRTSPTADRNSPSDSASADVNPLAAIGTRLVDRSLQGARALTGRLGDRSYAAFISYSHRDIAVARWLHKAIETYRVPRALVGREGDYGAVPARLRPVFRDEDELAGAAELGPKLEAALRNSRALIVVCSPAARRSTWVDNEIRTFKRMNPGRPVFAVIAEGAPGEGEQACFPESLLWELDEQGNHDRARPLEPLAPDLQKLDRRAVKLKLAAGLLGVPYDALNDREQRRRRVFAAAYGSASLILIAVLSTLSIAAFSYARIAVKERNAAEAARKAAETERNQAIAARDLAERRTWLAQQAAAQIKAFAAESCAGQPAPARRR